MTDDFNFWQDHSERFLIMAYEYDRNQKLVGADTAASKTGVCGDTVTVYLQIQNGRVTRLCYELQGCLHTNACCNSLAEMIENRSVETCWTITPDAVIDDLQTLPADHHHCAELVVGALYLALSHYVP